MRRRDPPRRRNIFSQPFRHPAGHLQLLPLGRDLIDGQNAGLFCNEAPVSVLRGVPDDRARERPQEGLELSHA